MSGFRVRVRLALIAGIVVAVGLPGAGVTALTTARAASAQTSATRYFPLTPYRILDTRIGQGARMGPLGAGQTLNVPVTGVRGPTAAQVVPTNATAVVMNVTVDQPTAFSFLTVWPRGSTRPTASNLNFVAGDIKPNLAQVALGSGGVSIFNHAGSTQLIGDVQGYFAPATASSRRGLFNPLRPARLLDTRDGTGAPRARLGSGATLDLQVTGRGGVPASGVGAVVLNVTVTNPTCPGPGSAPCSFLTVWPTGQPRPLASNGNFGTGETIADRAIVPVGSGGRVSIFNHAGSTDVVADVSGWFTDGSNAAARGDFYTPINPIRILDTRNGTGGHRGPVGPGQSILVPVGGLFGTPIPSVVAAAVANVTVTDGTAPSFLTVWAVNQSRPLASDLNWVARETTSNLISTQLSSGAGGAWMFFNHAGSTNMIADVGGFYRPAF